MSGKLIPGLSFEEYCALPGVNGSILKLVSRYSLEHVKAELEGVSTRESDALDMGHSFHELLLRGVESFIVRPETYPAPAKHPKVKAGEIKEGDPLDWNGNAGFCKAWESEHDGAQIHTVHEVSAIRGMAASIRADEEVAPYLAGDCEIALTGEKNGVAMKCLIDLLPHDPTAPVIDFKKCRSCAPGKFVKDANDLEYWIQAAFTLDMLALVGQRRTSFWFVAVEDKPPYSVSIAKLDDAPCSYIRVGRRRYRAAMLKLLDAREKNHWPGYGSFHPEDYAPAWMREELEATA